ncbi:MAG: hypothetical protein K0S04_639 [Herbinix sp.]|jgi:hypothetical protein|nr:hypothetical protein [Herbinix sp.]
MPYKVEQQSSLCKRACCGYNIGQTKIFYIYFPELLDSSVEETFIMSLTKGVALDAYYTTIIDPL